MGDLRLGHEKKIIPAEIEWHAGIGPTIVLPLRAPSGSPLIMLRLPAMRFGDNLGKREQRHPRWGTVCRIVGIAASVK